VSNPPIHILTHEFAPFTGGIAVYVAETARALAGLGHPTTVWAPDYRGVPDDSGFPFDVRRVRMRGQQDWLCRLRMARALRAAFPDGCIPGTLILAEPGPLRLWLYARLLRLPQPQRLALVVHGSELGRLAAPPYRHRRFAQLLAAAAVVGVVSSEIGERLCATWPQAAAKLARVPGAVRAAWRELPSVPRTEDRPLREIIQVGRLHPRKGQDLLVEAVARLPVAQRASLRVRLIGPVGRPRYARALRARIEQLRLPVSLDGPLPEAALRAAYESADLLVMPSRAHRASLEGLGIALLEAQHFGCPVIGARTGGIPEALLENHTGLLVPPDDPAALAAALQTLLADPARAAALGAAGPPFARARFSWTANALLLAGSNA